MGYNDEPTNTAMMAELKHIRQDVEEIKAAQATMIHELAGNGGPGIRTRLHALETGYNHLVDQLNRQDNALEKQGNCINKLDNQVVGMRNMGVGVIVGLTILEALRWIVPLLVP